MDISLQVFYKKLNQEGGGVQEIGVILFFSSSLKRDQIHVGRRY